MSGGSDTKPATTTTATADAAGQGQLYSPEYAVKVKAKGGAGKEREGMVMTWRTIVVIKERMLEKLSAAAVPADALDNARQYLESVVREVTVAAHGLTKDAIHRIRSHLVDLLPSLSPSQTRKMVDEVEMEMNKEVESSSERKEKDRMEEGGAQQQNHNPSSKL